MVEYLAMRFNRYPSRVGYLYLPDDNVDAISAKIMEMDLLEISVDQERADFRNNYCNLWGKKIITKIEVPAKPDFDFTPDVRAKLLAKRDLVVTWRFFDFARHNFQSIFCYRCSDGACDCDECKQAFALCDHSRVSIIFI